MDSNGETLEVRRCMLVNSSSHISICVPLRTMPPHHFLLCYPCTIVFFSACLPSLYGLIFFL